MDILNQLFGKILVPEAVAEEIQEKENRFKGFSEILQSGFIEVRQIKNESFSKGLKLDIDDGEAEAIVLAKELGSEIILMDELSARSQCKYHGLKPLGSIGCLILARNKGIITAVKPLLDDMRTLGNFWIKESLYESIVQDYG